MQECCYSVDLLKLLYITVCIVNLLNLWGKQMQLVFVLWFKKHKHCWPDFSVFVAKAQTRVATYNVWFICLIKRSANDTRLFQRLFTAWRVITTRSRQCRHYDNSSDGEDKFMTLFTYVIFPLRFELLNICNYFGMCY